MATSRGVVSFLATCYLAGMETGRLEIISEVRELEKRTMQIYLKLARRFSGDASPGELGPFWLSMARHEAGHIGALEMLACLHEQAEPSPCREIGSWDTTDAMFRLEQLSAECDGEVSVERAFEIAVEVESSEQDELILELVLALTDAKQREQAETMLLHDLSDLSLMIEKYAGNQGLLERIDSLVDRHVDRHVERRENRNDRTA